MAWQSRAFAHNVRRIARQRGIYVKDLCKAAGIGDSTFYGWISGRHRPSESVAELIAEQLGMTLEELNKEE